MEEKSFPFSDKEVVSFVQKNADYYLSKWKRLHETGSKLSWNWAGFLFTVAWLFYRKMYLYGLGFAIWGAIQSAIVTLLTLQESNPTASAVASLVSLFLSLAMQFIIGAFGNYMYYRKFVNTYRELKYNVSDEEALLETLKQKGGTSWGAVILFMILGSLVWLTIMGIVGGDTWSIEE